MATKFQRSRGAKEEIDKENSAYRAATTMTKVDLMDAHARFAEQANQNNVLNDEVANSSAHLDELHTENKNTITEMTTSLNLATDKANDLAV